jgi:hypothetical protein
MVKLFGNVGFDAYGHDFGRSLMILDDTLTAAEQGLEEKRARLVEEFANYEVSGKRIGEWDEDGRKVWEQSDIYQFDLELVDECLVNLRKSYVIAFYHTWERMVVRWAGVGQRANHNELRRGVESKGVRPHARLDAVRDLNNALKHNSRGFGANLIQSWPELLPPNFYVTKNYMIDDRFLIDWFSLITITKEQMREVIAALRASGPEAFPRAVALVAE